MPGKAGICGMEESVGDAGKAKVGGTGGVTSLDGRSGGRVACNVGIDGSDDRGGNPVPGKAGI